jgi:hypothetical protein
MSLRTSLFRLFWAASLSAGVLVACGGGGGGGGETSVAATAPVISAQPTSFTALEGASASFSVSATGTATLSYQWRKAGAAISGATSAAYTLPAVTGADAGNYDVVVSNSAGSVISSVATLTVSSPPGATAPAITTQPAAQTATVGASASFSVVASGGSLAYQWFKNGSAIGNATSSTYSIASVSSADAGSYNVTVSNSAGSATSSAAVLTVNSTSVGNGTLAAAATTAAQGFVATLSASQQTAVQLPWSLDSARRWSNLPAQMVARNGVAWGTLSTAQKTAARTLINTALGATGNALHEGMQAADDYLSGVGGGSTYGNAPYYIAFLGTPSASGFWMLQLSGHHLTYNIAFNGAYLSPTPLFLGIEPKAAFTVNGIAYDPMEAQRTAMANLGTALVAYPGALLSGTYGDLLFGANGTGGIDNTCPRNYASVTSRGLPYASLSASDQALVQATIRAYVNTQASETSTALLADYLSSAALASTYVAYAGTGSVSTNGNYFRIEGPRLWIEFSVQRGIIINSDIHYHTIWRDKLADYGGKCVP